VFFSFIVLQYYFVLHIYCYNAIRQSLIELLFLIVPIIYLPLLVFDMLHSMGTSTVLLFILYTHICLTYQLMPLPLLHSFICSILPSFETLALDHFLFAVIEERAIIPVCMPKTRSIPEIRRL
jgi:hypothetical protein